MLSYTVPGVIGTLLTAVLFIGLAVFVFLQKSRSDALSPLVIVAAGFGLLGLVPVLALPLDIIQGFLEYGTADSIVRVIRQFIAGIGLYGGVTAIVVGSTLTAAKLAERQDGAL